MGETTLTRKRIESIRTTITFDKNGTRFMIDSERDIIVGKETNGVKKVKIEFGGKQVRRHESIRIQIRYSDVVIMKEESKSEIFEEELDEEGIGKGDIRQGIRECNRDRIR